MVLSDGFMKIPDPPDSQNPGLPENARGETIEILCLFIDTGTRKIMLDTGSGEGFQPTTGKLLSNLEAADINPADIDTIIHTHGHGDHVGGCFSPVGKPTFPNAHYFVPRKEWDYWNNPPEKIQHVFMYDVVRQHYLSMPEKVDRVEHGVEFLPGFKFLPSPGHTPGNCMLEITSGSQQLLCAGDIIHTAVEFIYPEYYTYLDAVPEEAVTTRDRILSDAARTGQTLFACHFPFPGLGRILSQENSFSWQPVESIS